MTEEKLNLSEREELIMLRKKIIGLKYENSNLKKKMIDIIMYSKELNNINHSKV